jgi:SAM-dependent methyltransferase
VTPLRQTGDARHNGSRQDPVAAAYDPGTYGRGVAEVYDALYRSVPETDEAVEALAELSAGGRILEMGIGTGRLALPLRARGVHVAGIEGSEEMLAQLREKPGGGEIPVSVGDFAEVRVEGRFSVVVLALHTIFGLPTPEHQIRCFENAARHLAPEGVFVVEARVIDPADFKGGQAIEPRFSDAEQVELQVQRFDQVTQRMEVTNIHLSGEGIQLNAYVNQYTTPREFDLMARIAGLRLRDRWEGWRREPFTSHSRRHVSVYERRA